jgi:hypothetical protein
MLRAMIPLPDLGGHASTGSQPKYIEGRRQVGLVPRCNQQRPGQGGVRRVGHARWHLDDIWKAPGHSVCRACPLRCSAASDTTQSVRRITCGTWLNRGQNKHYRWLSKVASAFKKVMLDLGALFGTGLTPSPAVGILAAVHRDC